MERILTFFDQAAFHAVLDVGQLDSTVPNRATSEIVKQVRLLHHILWEGHALAEKQALVAIEIADQFGVRADLRILLYQSANGGREARGEATSGEKSDLRHDYVYYKDERTNGLIGLSVSALISVRFEPAQASSDWCKVTNAAYDGRPT